MNRELATLRRILRLAYEWKEIDRVPRIRLLGGERIRDFVLSRAQERIYLEACPQPLKDIAVLMLETGLRIGETLALEWPDVVLEPLSGSCFGYIRIREGKSKNARRTLPLTDRAGECYWLGERAEYPTSSLRTVKGSSTWEPRSITFTAK